MLSQLLGRGYLPQELPELFSSTSFQRVVAVASGAPAPFTGPNVKWSQPAAHNLGRPGGLRRRLAVPNPVSFYRLAALFDAERAALLPLWQRSTYSKTRPDPAAAGVRGIAPVAQDRVSARVQVRVGVKYVLRADIAQFYPSIYTHAIPWAIHSKPVAKANMRNAALLGNKLDKEVQGGQNGQTKGVLIGPDTSLGIAEILMGVVD